MYDSMYAELCGNHDRKQISCFGIGSDIEGRVVLGVRELPRNLGGDGYVHCLDGFTVV